MELTEEQITSGLGVAAVGLGGMFALLPGFMNKMAGLNLSENMESRLMIRLLGMRDISMGAGMLLNRTKPEASQQWRRILAFNAITDVALFGLALPRSKSKLKTLMAITTSGAVAFFSLR
ncbi:MAG: hypothetical protein HXX08_16355 [Chloroflexi bacterium]|uniref:DUF4267 domain-containing protein n=1 Tax=Candidatus Chlorohelix allophototropha TaxID=3003348 RepID=A0A8T7M622_9CHLR|nr:hypothetical protein [Chloroflexota bacterium]WJW69344.1 hypothetical protein OZ401_002952 [Chloroflexota bacterium L227-S17]